ncbi:MAG: hypothetical protein AVDCRST_MAG70-2487 [uncultured Thermomicrobiales bacterium]|uniref:Uncharacterized protein n=1 Tax=uncultured Thermomicrobiales bacterium TaxID=1645740 RepID=A0A6J4V9I8_9BACT|nr:MAG: hypothetical protein AVDCRST_MAG70-2487 [uncultured Thermomicrobiales bacterium]
MVSHRIRGGLAYATRSKTANTDRDTLRGKTITIMASNTVEQAEKTRQAVRV